MPLEVTTEAGKSAMPIAKNEGAAALLVLFPSHVCAATVLVRVTEVNVPVLAVPEPIGPGELQLG